MKQTIEAHIGEMSIMDHSGHKELKWNTALFEEVAQAQKTFDDLTRMGYSAFASKEKAQVKHLINQFDPTAAEVIMVPKTVGG